MSSGMLDNARECADAKKRLQWCGNQLHIRPRDAAVALTQILQGSPKRRGGSFPVDLSGGAGDGSISSLARPGPWRFHRSFASMRRDVVPSRPGPRLQRRRRGRSRRARVCGGTSLSHHCFCLDGCSVASLPRSPLYSAGHLALCLPWKADGCFHPLASPGRERRFPIDFR